MNKILLVFLGFFVFLCPTVFAAGVIMDGLYLSYDDNGLRLLENYTGLKREGLLLHYFENGEVDKIFEYHRNERDGFAVGYYPDNKIQYRVHFKGGIQDGPAERFYANGYLAVELWYRDGRPDGVGRYYNEEGVLEKVALYSWGKLVRVRSCDAQGHIENMN